MYKINLILRFILIRCFWWQLYFVIASNNTYLSPPITGTVPSLYVRLLCVDIDLATVQWSLIENQNLILENTAYDTEWNNEVNLILIYQNETIKEDYVRNLKTYTFRNLQSNSWYHVVVRAKSVSADLNFITASENLNHQPLTKLQAETLINVSNTLANVLVEWEQAKDFPACSYNLSWSYLLNTSSTVVQMWNQPVLQNLVYNVCYNFSLTPIFGKEISSTNEARIESFCPMLEGHNMSGTCTCTDQTCTVTINWAPVNVSQDFIETRISSLNRTPIFRNISKTATSIVYSHLEFSDPYEFDITTNARHGPYRKQFSANPNSACLLFIPEAPQMERMNLRNEKNKSGFCDVTIDWTSYYPSSRGPDQVLIEIMQPGFKIIKIFDGLNITGETIIVNNLTLESDYQIEMSVIFDQIILCKFFWKNLSCSKPKEATIPERTYDSIIVIGILAGMAMAWTFLFTLLSFHKWIVSDPDSNKKEYKIQVKNNEYNHRIKRTKNNENEYCKLILGDMLGSGAFGIVFKGILILNSDKKLEVAVKTLRSNASQAEILQFKKEISLMENVGIHKNIVSTIGSSCDGDRPLLIVEYCPFGDLHAYLRKNYEQILRNLDNLSGNSEKLIYQNFGYKSSLILASHFNAKDQHSAENKLYGLVSEGTTVNSNLTFCDLLSYARQVAIGMEYLASNYVVHRDLAARNILLSDNKTVKISDFGLSRDIYTENIYRITGKGERMPIKWMALESICLQEYTTLTDVYD